MEINKKLEIGWDDWLGSPWVMVVGNIFQSKN